MTEDEYKDNENEDENFSSITMGNLPTFFCFSRNIEIIKRSSIASVAWLDSVDKVSHDILSKLCTIIIGSFLFNPQEIVISAAINATTRHCRNCPDQVNTGPVLTVLTIMATNNDLKAIGIRLLTELWLQEERIFPNLLDILERCNYNKHEQDDYQIACSLSIREICKIRPNTYGKDTLPLVAKILAPSNGEVNIISKAAALEGLYYLCEAKVVDLVTVWNVFVVHLSGDHRLAYIQKSAKYEEFNNQALQKLWHYTLFKEKEIRLAAFTALAEFSLTQMNITCLPTILKEILKRSSKDHSLESDETNTNQLLSGQDICNLILYYPNDCLPGIEPWITQLIKEDLEALCHADIYKANRKSEQGDANSIYESISVKLWKAYQACNNQTMLSNLAGGLLFAYDPRINYDSVDDEKNCHYYLSMLESALFEITFDPTDWYAIIHLLMAWSDFMNRVMQACIEYHKSQILMRSTSGDAQNELKDETEETLFRCCLEI
ncbi:uncharacterized protein TRIADDRAFT_54119 [Trichoplax adhaerens]|uniref:DUF3730 domain-containing protein n=1 Tax=Trichoplax adhaerens TaxID=10228 RepID=B3RR59_TRIAD|nr:hypothetical protein TRIADDRAFT_54119 [Trichoplax adhaerens]EDV26286.1 hypothetical protein TRIADDRAFT_54119 [Trichoplax adhaerens]|eukprot:XP_002110282.1 hypothetical protein TRIADDRAFT_54119 [Trichoplax adhaerens]